MDGNGNAVFLRKFVFDTGSVLGPRKSAGYANDPIIGPAGIRNPLNVAADLVTPLFFCAESEGPSFAPTVCLTDIGAADFVSDGISLGVSFTVAASSGPVWGRRFGQI